MMKSSTNVKNGSRRQRGRNIVICCDGTALSELHHFGQSLTPSNITKIYNLIDVEPPKATAAKSKRQQQWRGKGVSGSDYLVNCSSEDEDEDEDYREQIAFYERGIATKGGTIRKSLEGLTGNGIDAKIITMYRKLGTTYREYENNDEEDRVFLFGFSRGSFAVRSLNGMIFHVGLLNLHGLDSEEIFHRVNIAYNKGYRKRLDRIEWAYGTKGDKKDKTPWKFFDPLGDGKHKIPIHFVAALDTVGQLGLPREKTCLWMMGLICRSKNRNAFHDMQPKPTNITGISAVAIDEMRATFQPMYVRKFIQQYSKEGLDVKQAWFPGSHANIGGGLADSGLSDGVLKWVVDEAAAKGLRFNAKMMEQIKPNYKGSIYYPLLSPLYQKLTHYPRSVPPIIPSSLKTPMEFIHESALLRSQDPPITDAPYFNTHRLEVGEKYDTSLQAKKLYNHTFVYLKKGEKYRFSAQGRWSGYRNKVCGPEGYSTSAFNRPLAINMGIGLGRLERGLRAVTRNYEAKLKRTRRHDHYPWYCLMGMISSAGTRDSNTKADFHDIIYIGKESEHIVPREGYFHCYANDCWRAYEKNRGELLLTIERLE